MKTKLLAPLFPLLVPAAALAQATSTVTSTVSGSISPEEIETGFGLIGSFLAAVMSGGWWVALASFLVPLAVLVLNFGPIKGALRSDGPLDWLRPLILALVTAGSILAGMAATGFGDLGSILGALGSGGVVAYLQKALQEWLD